MKDSYTKMFKGLKLLGGKELRRYSSVLQGIHESPSINKFERIPHPTAGSGYGTQHRRGVGSSQGSQHSNCAEGDCHLLIVTVPWHLVQYSPTVRRRTRLQKQRFVGYWHETGNVRRKHFCIKQQQQMAKRNSSVHSTLDEQHTLQRNSCVHSTLE
jgi:hypothetical protein